MTASISAKQNRFMELNVIPESNQPQLRNVQWVSPSASGRPAGGDQILGGRHVLGALPGLIFLSVTPDILVTVVA